MALPGRGGRGLVIQAAAAGPGAVRRPAALRLAAAIGGCHMVVQWYDQRLNSLATRVQIPLHASGIRETVWVLSPPNLQNRTNAPECQP
jgi:hypothetical protein